MTKQSPCPRLNESPKRRGFLIYSLDEFPLPGHCGWFAIFCLKNVSGMAHCFAVLCISLTSNAKSTLGKTAKAQLTLTANH